MKKYLPTDNKIKSNNYIVTVVHDHINIEGISRTFGVYDNIEDLKQIVYLRMLNYDNIKLNNVFQNGALLSFVYSMTRNIIQHKSEFSLDKNPSEINFSMIDNFDVENTDEYDYDKEMKIRYVENALKKTRIDKISDTNYRKLNEEAMKQVFKEKMNGNTFKELSEKYQISVSVLKNVVKDYKYFLKVNYKG